MITDKQQITVDEADRVLRADYWDDVRSVVDNAADEIENGNITTDDELSDWLHETIDGHSNIIYTRSNFHVLLYSDNSDAYADEFGEEGMIRDGNVNWPALAYAAMLADVRDTIGDFDEFIDQHKPSDPDDETDTDDADDDGTSGQDRESYTDTQDRKTYSVDRE